MPYISARRLAILLLGAAVSLGGPPAWAGPATQIPVGFLEPSETKAGSPSETKAGAAPELRGYRRLAPADPRLSKATGLLDNEAARFIRTLLASGRDAIPVGSRDGGWPAELLVALVPGGNHAKLGLSVEADAGKITKLERTPYVQLDLTPDRMSATLLHEGGHVAHYLAKRNKAVEPGWTPLPHTTFAVTDRQTALSEGYAIHFETLWGHFGQEADRQSFYHHDAPAFGPESGFGGEFFFGIRDMLSYSQNWARYQSVRDGLPAFQGYSQTGDYQRAQIEPARDVSALKSPGQMLASEGLVASYCFRLAARRAAKLGARRGGGLDQPGILQAETELLQGLRNAHDQAGTNAHLLDLMQGYAALGADFKAAAIDVYVDLTRGVTADRTVQGLWKDLYSAGTVMDMARVQALFLELQTKRAQAAERARADLATLGAATGPVVPVQIAAGANVHLVAFGDAFPVEFDLNAAGQGDWAAVPGLSQADRDRIAAEEAKGPFASLPDFWRRTGFDPAKVALKAM